jgi:hypothetical protein
VRQSQSVKVADETGFKPEVTKAMRGARARVSHATVTPKLEQTGKSKKRGKKKQIPDVVKIPSEA